MIPRDDITALVLAGGRGSRMGGVDKGLQPFRGVPLAQHSLHRIAAQVGSVLLNANRNIAQYQALGAPVWPDGEADFPGPLAGFLVGLERCETPYLLTVPCDTPLFPHDLADRLAQALEAEQAEIAMASAREEDGQLRTQPVFCLLKRALAPSLRHFMEAGGRKIDVWTAQHRTAIAAFDRPGDDARAFFNANTPAELHALEQSP